MGVFARLSDLLKSNINDLIDKAEDPEKMVKQIIADMQKELTRATQNYGKAKASERLAETKYKDALSVSSDWENKAKAALARGDQNLAKQALSRKVKADADVASYQQMYESISTQTVTIGEQVELLKSKLEEAKSRQAMLIARAQMADTKRQLAAAQGGFDSSSALEKLNRMEEKVQQKEAEADAFAEISGTQQDDLQQTFQQIENEQKVDMELQRLIAEMNGNAAPEEITPETAPLDGSAPDNE